MGFTKTRSKESMCQILRFFRNNAWIHFLAILTNLQHLYAWTKLVDFAKKVSARYY